MSTLTTTTSSSSGALYADQITLQLDGERYTLLELMWLHVAPCGCACGASTADVGTGPNGDGPPAVTAEQKMRDDYDNKQKYDRDVKLGFHYALVTTQHYHAALDANPHFLNSCHHTPKWGRPDETPPPGYVWMTRDGMGSTRTYRRHLVPSANLEPQKIPVRDSKTREILRYSEYNYLNNRTSSLCKRSTRGNIWSDAWWNLDGTITCDLCLNAAEALRTTEPEASHANG